MPLMITQPIIRTYIRLLVNFATSKSSSLKLGSTGIIKNDFKKGGGTKPPPVVTTLITIKN